MTTYRIYKLNETPDNLNNSQAIRLPLQPDLIQCWQYQGGGEYIYRAFDGNHTTYFKLATHPNIPAEGTLLGRITTSDRQRGRHRRTLPRALDSIKITPAGREMRIPLPLPLPSDIELLPDDAKNAIHCYILALAFRTKSAHFRQRTADASQNNNIQEISKIHTEINEFTLKYCHGKQLNPVCSNAKAQKIWSMIARHTQLQDTLDGSREHIFSTINLVKSGHRERKEIEFRSLTLITIAFGASTLLFNFSKTISSPESSYDTAYAVIAIILVIYATFATITKSVKTLLWLSIAFVVSLFIMPPLYVLKTKHITKENQELPARTSFFNCAPQAQSSECLHTTTNPYYISNNCCGWCVDYSITRGGGDATEAGGFYPRHTHQHQ